MAQHAMTQPSAPQSSVAQLPVAHLERRFLAFVIDRTLAWSLTALAGLITWLAVGADLTIVALAATITMVVLWLALTIVVGIWGTSPGKSLTGLRVVHHGTGTPIGVGPALARALVLGLAGIPTFGIGVATLAWTAVEDRGGQRRGWHDHLTHSVVVDVRPAPIVTQSESDDGPRHIVNLTAMRLIPAPMTETPATPTRSPEQSVRRRPAAANPAPAASASQPLAPTPPPAPTSAPTPVSPPIPAPAPGPGGWRVRFDHGETFRVEGMVLVGRRPEPRTGEVVSRLLALPSPDMSVSKTHAQFGPAPDGALVVMDRGSTNGTTVVRKGVVRQLAPGRPTTLIDGDTVVFGDCQMTVAAER